MTKAKAGNAGLVFAAEPPSRLPVQGTNALFPVHRIYCVGRNYRAHAEEMGLSLREPPFFFSKPADAVFTGASLPYPPMTSNLHHEAELLVALDGGGKNIRTDQALGLVMGYSVGVDLTRRDLQAEAKQKGRPWTTAKGFDRSAPVSAIRPVAAGGHPQSAAITLWVNGEMRQRGNTDDMTWSVAEIIAELSRYFELKAGDLIFTGTPAGVGPVVPGDRIDCEIETVGSLSFQVTG
jgi:fumarylpyruvate hydrolase